MADAARLAELIEPEVKAEGLELVRVMMIGGKDDPTLQVMAERPETGQLTLEDCARLSRRLSERLDETDPIEESYRLEVSSPGIDRPLTRRRDYADWTGHEARISLAEKIDGRREFRGTLAGIEGDEILIDVANAGVARLPFADVHSAKLLLTDRLLAATAPLSPEGADEIETDANIQMEGQD
jgi:ribosome maturation factor RimP